MIHILVNNLINEMANGGALADGVGMMMDCTVTSGKTSRDNTC